MLIAVQHLSTHKAQVRIGIMQELETVLSPQVRK